MTVDVIQVSIHHSHNPGEPILFEYGDDVEHTLLVFGHFDSALIAVNEMLEKQPVVSTLDNQEAPSVVRPLHPDRIGVDDRAALHSPFGPCSSIARSHRSPMISGE